MWYFLLIAFVFGVCIGSFLNVCVYRLPLDQSIAKPSRSYCPHCQKSIAWMDNIPLVSIILLRAKCRYCSGKISWRYFIVELITGLACVACFWGFAICRNDLVLFMISFFLICLLIVATFVDFEYQIIPDEINLLGAVVGLIVSTLYPPLHESLDIVSNPNVNSLLAACAGLIVGGGICWSVRILGGFLFRKEAMGFGDVKFLAMIGVFIGWKNILLVFFLSPFIGLPIALFMKISKNEGAIPYGPYLSAATVLVMFARDEILQLLLP